VPIRRTRASLMTQTELDEIRARLRKASTGPWAVKRMPNLWRSKAGDGRTHPCVRTFRVPKRIYEIASEQVEKDAAFMAHARQDVSALLAEFDTTRAALYDVRMALRELMHRESADPRDFDQLLSRLSATSAPWSTPLTPQKRPGVASGSSGIDAQV